MNMHSLLGVALLACFTLAKWLFIHISIGILAGIVLGGGGALIHGEYFAFGLSFGLPVGIVLSSACGILSGITIFGLSIYERQDLLRRLAVSTTVCSVPLLVIPELGVVLSAFGAILGYFIGLGLFWARRIL